MFQEKTIFFLSYPLLQTLALTDRKSTPPRVLEALIFTKNSFRNSQLIYNQHSARDTQSLLQDNIVLEYRKDLSPYIHITLPAMSTKIVLVVVSTCFIRLLISSSVRGFPSTNSFLSLGSFRTTSSSFSWLFLKSSS